LGADNGKSVPEAAKGFQFSQEWANPMLSTNRPAPRIALTALSLLILLYSLIIAQQILLGVLAVVAVWLVYIFYGLVVTLGRIAGALERLVEAREAEIGREFDD